jgi:Domain of unknown function (DUF5615)
MLRLLADENFNHDLIRGVLRRLPSLDLIRVQDAGLREADDPAILEWAAHERRLVLTHDANTMPAFAYDRIRRKEAMPGMFVVSQQAGLNKIIEDLLLLAECSNDREWDGQVIYLPFP